MKASAANDVLNRRFVTWARRYGAGGLLGGACVAERIAIAVERDAANDPAPPDAADQIELIVRAMEASGRWKEARVLRLQYAMPDAPESLRLAKLRRKGLHVSRAAYYIYLDTAQAYVAGALSMLEDALQLGDFDG